MTDPSMLDQAALASLLEMTGGDEAFLAELIDTYLADAGDLRATMRQALATGDAPGLRRAAHSLKSNSATFGATTLAALCQDLEERAAAGTMDGAAERVDRVDAVCPEVEAALRAARPPV